MKNEMLHWFAGLVVGTLTGVFVVFDFMQDRRERMDREAAAVRELRLDLEAREEQLFIEQWAFDEVQAQNKENDR